MVKGLINYVKLFELYSAGIRQKFSIRVVQLVGILDSNGGGIKQRKINQGETKNYGQQGVGYNIPHIDTRNA